MADTILYDLADAFLRAAVAGMDEDRRPARQIVPEGPDFAHDCHLIAVEFVRQYTARLRTQNTQDRPTARSATQGGVRIVEYRMTLVLDCIPTGQTVGQGFRPPSADDVNATSRLLLSDAWSAKQGIRDALADGTIFDHFADLEPPVPVAGRCQGVELQDLPPFGPSGGTAGVRMTILAEF